MIFNKLTIDKFNERILPQYPPRTPSKHSDNTQLNGSFTFYDHSTPTSETIEELKNSVTDPHHMYLVSSINRHNRLAGCLGILPNQLIQLVQLTQNEHKEKILSDLRFTAFWATYDIWKKRQSLNRNFWKSIIPDPWREESKIKKREKINSKKGKPTRHPKPSSLEDCRNPFHYLLLKDPFSNPRNLLLHC